MIMGSLIMNNNISQYVVEHYLENKTLTSWGSEDCVIKGASSQIKLKHMNGKLRKQRNYFNIDRSY